MLKRQLFAQPELSNLFSVAENKQNKLYDVITQSNVVISTWMGDCGRPIPQCNYDISKILALIETKFNLNSATQLFI